MKSNIYNGHNVHLIESVEEFKFIRENINPQIGIGIDTETTGLDYIHDKIVGVCISVGKSWSKDQYRGFYLPVRHNSYPNNLPIYKVIEFVQWIIDNFYTYWWNRNYDNTMLEKEGLKCPYVGKTNDVQCMAHLIKNESYPALKDYAKELLKYSVIEFSTNKADQGNFGTTDPEISFVYAAQDPLVTALLGRKIWSEYPYIQKIYPLDNKFAEAMRCISRDADIYLDKDMLQRVINEMTAKQAEIKRQIFAITGYEFRLSSTADKADAISRFYTLTTRTKTGKLAVTQEILESIDHPLAKLMVEYSKLEKQIGTYIKKMLDFPNPFKVNYQHCNVPTGRLSSGASKGNSYFAQFNIQNVPKKELYRYLHKGSQLGYFVSESPLTSCAGSSLINGSPVSQNNDFEKSSKPGKIYKVEIEGQILEFAENSLVNVLRDGQIHTIPIEDLKEGDDLQPNVLISA